MNRVSKKVDFTKIKIIIVDCDGILTDGSLIYTDKGEEVKSFCSLDGLGIRLLSFSDIEFAIVTGRVSDCLVHRCKDLKVDMLYQNAKNKLFVIDKILKKKRLSYRNIAYMGDDINDLPVLKKAAFSASAKDPSDDIKDSLHWVSNKKGGFGCVREMIDLILKKSKKYEATKAKFFNYLNKY